MLLKECRKNHERYITIVEWQKMFDSFYRGALWKVLKKQAIWGLQIVPLKT